MKKNIELKFLCIITNHGICDKILKAIGKKLNFCHVALGHGTANSEVLSVLGLDGSEKDVALCTVLKEDLKDIFKVLSEKFQLEKSGNGIAFTIPVLSVGGGITLQLLSGKRGIEKI